MIQYSVDLSDLFDTTSVVPIVVPSGLHRLLLLIGLKKGMEKGDARTLKRLRARKFGPLTPDRLERIGQADDEQLEIRLDRVLEVNSLNSVFG